MNKQKQGVERPSEARLWYDRTWARNRFMLALQDCAPPAVLDLKKRLLPEFAAIAPQRDDDLMQVLHSARYDEMVEKLKAPSREWATKHLLFHSELAETDVDAGGKMLLDWMEPVIVFSFMNWSLQPRATHLKWSFQTNYSVVAHSEEPLPFRLKIDGWPVLRETAVAFRQRAEADFAEALRKYMDQKLPVDNKRPADDKEARPRLPTKVAEHHFDWLVRFQVLSESARVIGKQIADRDSRSNQPWTTVMKGVKSAADAIIGPSYGAWLRRPKGGRPRNVK